MLTDIFSAVSPAAINRWIASAFTEQRGCQEQNGSWRILLCETVTRRCCKRRLSRIAKGL
jgi:hypothetical protein